MIIREERQGDEERIRGVNLAAFETSTEADLVDALRRQPIDPSRQNGRHSFPVALRALSLAGLLHDEVVRPCMAAGAGTARRSPTTGFDATEAEGLPVRHGQSKAKPSRRQCRAGFGPSPVLPLPDTGRDQVSVLDCAVSSPPP
jgi:hypothetical protein